MQFAQPCMYYTTHIMYYTIPYLQYMQLPLCSSTVPYIVPRSVLVLSCHHCMYCCATCISLCSPLLQFHSPCHHHYLPTIPLPIYVVPPPPLGGTQRSCLRLTVDRPSGLELHQTAHAGAPTHRRTCQGRLRGARRYQSDQAVRMGRCLRGQTQCPKVLGAVADPY